MPILRCAGRRLASRSIVSTVGPGVSSTSPASIKSGYFQLHSFARDHLGALLLLGAREQLELHRWTGLAPPPILPPPAPPPISDIPLAMHNAQLEPGVTYRYPLNTHCGWTCSADSTSSGGTA